MVFAMVELSEGGICGVFIEQLSLVSQSGDVGVSLALLPYSPLVSHPKSHVADMTKGRHVRLV